MSSLVANIRWCSARHLNDSCEHTAMGTEAGPDGVGDARASELFSIGELVDGMLSFWSSSICMSEGSSRSSRFRLFECGVLLWPASLDLMWLCAHDG